MRLICLQGNNLEADRITIAENIKTLEVIYIYTGSKDLYKYIDELALDDQILYRLKICKEKLGIDVTLVDCEGQKKKISKLSYLLQEIEPDQKYQVIINNNDRTVLAHIVQQLVYLSISLENIQVLTDKEQRDNVRLNRFMSNINELENTVNMTGYAISSIVKDGEFDEVRDKILNSLNKIKVHINASKKVELKLAVAASKKTGKSVIVNSMIGEELAPTSLELATPNNCIYQKSQDDKYHLKYNNGDEESFETADEIKSFITNEFKRAQDDAKNAFTIEDMHINYKTEKNNFEAYTIYDTPGPDLAGATGHKEAAKRAMQAADVVIFAIDYSKYLTDSEEQYLKEIKEMFNKQGKFYSLIFAVNKLDCRYTSEGDKSVVRILDFIRSKLIKLDAKYEDCVIMGTSALTYFYAHTAPRIKDCECLTAPKEYEYDNFTDALESCIENYISRPEMTNLNFINEQRSRSRNFHGVRLNSLDEIKESSGMPSLLSYVKYIAKGRAVAECIQYNSNQIDQEYAMIKNIFNINELEEKISKNQEKIESIRSILKKFNDEVNGIFLSEFMMTEIQCADMQIINEIAAELKSNGKECNIENIEDIFCTQLNTMIKDKDFREHIDSELKSQFRQDIQKLSEVEGLNEESEAEAFTNCFKDFCENMSYNIRTIINNYLTEKSTIYYNEAHAISDDITSVLNRRMESFKRAVEVCKKDLEVQYNIVFSFILPNFQFDFSKIIEEGKDIELDFIQNIEGLGKDFIIETKEIDTSSIWAAIRSFFISDYRKTKRTLKYSLESFYDSEQFDKLYAPIGKEIHYGVDKANIEEFYRPAMEMLGKDMERFFSNISTQFKAFNKQSIEQIKGISDILDGSKEYTQDLDILTRKKVYLEGIYGKLVEFNHMWSNIRG